MSDFWSRIFSSEKTRAAAKTQSWRDLVKSVLDGKATPEGADKALAGMGRTAAELREAVALLEKRRTAHASLLRGQKAAEERKGLEAKLSALRDSHGKKMEALAAEFQQQSTVLEQQIREAERLEGIGNSSELFLFDSAGPADPDTAAGIAETEAALKAARARLGVAQHGAHAAELASYEYSSSARAGESRDWDVGGKQAAAALRNRAKAQDDLAGEHRAAARPAAAEVAQLEQRLEELRRRQLEP
jgi:hypothetical protein